MGVNKVEANGETLIDLTSDSVTPETLANGVTATNSAGEKIVGTMVVEPQAIIDVGELPTENIKEDMFYRLIFGSFVYNQYTQSNFVCYFVEEMPEVGEPVIEGNYSNINNSTKNIYYNTVSGTTLGYVTEELSSIYGLAVGWHSADSLLGSFGINFSGVITNIDDDPMDNTIRLLLEYILYSYKDGKWTSYKVIGWVGGSKGAEIFNNQLNEADGKYSHAEGDNTIARAESQHVQGRYNIEDNEEKYAHIVGNGDSTSRSNAHTLDWNGVAWFASEVKVGGTGQDDSDAKTLATVEYVDQSIGSGTPEYNPETDEGKFFRIQGGVAGWFSVPNAEDNTF